MGYGLVAAMPFHLQRPWHTDVSSSKALVVFMRKEGVPFKVMAQFRKIQRETGMDIALIKTKPEGYNYPNQGLREEATFSHVRAILPGGTVVRIAGLDLEFAHRVLSSPALQDFANNIETRTTTETSRGTKIANIYVNVRRNNPDGVTYDFNSPIEAYLTLSSESLDVKTELQRLEDVLVGQLEGTRACPWPVPGYLVLNISQREIPEAA